MLITLIIFVYLFIIFGLCNWSLVAGIFPIDSRGRKIFCSIFGAIIFIFPTSLFLVLINTLPPNYFIENYVFSGPGLYLFGVAQTICAVGWFIYLYFVWNKTYD